MTVYLNGKFLPLDDARISVLDRGFIYGDGVYELIPVYHRQPYRLPQHLARLQRSLDGIRLANPHTEAQWGAIIHELIARQPFEQQGVYFQVTRGVAAVTAVDERWLHCDSKTISLVANVLARQFAAEHDAVETVLFRDGYLTEASASNVLIVRQSRIIAPPKDNHILPGITYDATLELAREGGLPFEVRPVTKEEAFAADEMWLSSSTKEVLAVTTLDGRAFAGGRPGALFRRMHALFQESKPRARNAA